MKQQKHKTLKLLTLCLMIAFIAIFASGILVACNRHEPSDKPTDETPPLVETPTLLKQLFPVIDKSLGYLTAQDPDIIPDCEMYIWTFFLPQSADSDSRIPYYWLEIGQSLYNNGDDDNDAAEPEVSPIYIGVFENEQIAQTAYDLIQSNQRLSSFFPFDCQTDGALIISEKAAGSFEEAQPAALCEKSQEALDFIKDGILKEATYNIAGNYAVIMPKDAQTIDRSILLAKKSAQGNRYAEYHYYLSRETAYQQFKDFEPNKYSYTDDSYVNISDDSYNYTCDREGLQFVLNDDCESYSVNGYGYDTPPETLNLVIPKSCGTMPVTRINALDRDLDIASITIPKSVTSIDERAFESYENIVSADIPAFALKYLKKEYLQALIINGEDLPYRLISNCNALTKLTLSNSVKSIAENAIVNCPNLAEITYDGTLAEWEAVEKSSNWIDRWTITVRCKDGTKTEVINISSDEVFEKLWTTAYNKIGSKNINKSDSVSMNFDIQLALNAISNADSKLVNQTLIGIDFTGYYDRNTTTSDNSVFKLRLYNPSDNNKTLFSLYLYADDRNNTYIEYEDLMIKIPHNLYSFIADDPNISVPEDFSQTSIAFGLDYILNQFGGDWSLNDPINALLYILKVNLKPVFEQYGGYLGIDDYNSLFSYDSFLCFNNFNTLRFLQTPFIQKIFLASRERLESGTLYNLTLDNTALSFLSGMSEVLTEMFGTSSNNNNKFSLILNEENNSVNSLSVLARLGGIQTLMSDKNSGDEISIVPEIVLTIKDFNIQKSNGANNINVNKSDFTDTVAIQNKISVDVQRANIRNIEITIVGKLDFANVTDNKTAINIYIDISGDGWGDNHRFATASFMDSTFALAFEDEVHTHGQLIKGFVFDTKTNAAQLLRKYVQQIFFSQNGSAQTATNGNNAVITKVFGVANSLLSIWQPDANLKFKANDLLSFILSVYSKVNPDASNLTRDRLLDNILSAIQERADYISELYFDDCINILQGNIVTSSDGTVTFTVDDAITKLALLFADEYCIFGFNEMPTISGLIPIIRAMLGATVSASVSIADGLQIHIDVSIEGYYYSISIDNTVDVIDATGLTFEDVYLQYVNAADNEKGKWMDFQGLFANEAHTDAA